MAISKIEAAKQKWIRKTERANIEEQSTEYVASLQESGWRVGPTTRANYERGVQEAKRRFDPLKNAEKWERNFSRAISR